MKLDQKTSLLNICNALWFNTESKIVIRDWDAALCKFKKDPLTSNLNSFKLLRAKARKTIKQAKKISWQNYVNKLNLSTKTVWKMICKISISKPIALTSCLCKTMKQMVNKRLVWFIESNNLFTNFLSNFKSW